MKARIQKRLRNYKRRIQYRLRKKQWDEQRHPMFQDQHIHYDIAAKSKGLNGAGLGALHLLVQRLGRLGTVLSSVYILPLLFSSVAVGITWGFLYNPQFGPLYYIYNAFGQQAPGWLGNPTWAIWAVSVVVLVVGTPPGVAGTVTV